MKWLKRLFCKHVFDTPKRWVTKYMHEPRAGYECSKCGKRKVVRL